MHHLKSTRNANRVLKEMDPYLSSFYDGQKIYYLNKEGRERVGSHIPRKKITTAQHYIMRNDLYIHYNRHVTWKNEIRMISGKDSNKITVVADAHFIHNNKHHIVEIDNMQKMSKNSVKIAKYRRLIERNAFKGMPVLIWVTTSMHRQESLLNMCDGLDVRIFLNTDFN
jgi:hypothetical protein